MRLLIEPFLQKHPEFVLKQRILFRVPIAHFTIGMAFERTGHKDQVCLRWYVQFLFAPPPFFRGGLGTRMDRSWGIIGATDLQQKMIGEMESVIADVIPIDTLLEDIFEVNKRADRNFGVMQENSRGLLLASLGNFSAASAELQSYVDRKRRVIENWHSNPGYPKGSKRWEADRELFSGVQAEVEHIAKLIISLDRDDANGVASILHSWEAMAVEAKKLERYWMPSPFPFEIA